MSLKNLSHSSIVIVESVQQSNPRRRSQNLQRNCTKTSKFSYFGSFSGFVPSEELQTQFPLEGVLHT